MPEMYDDIKRFHRKFGMEMPDKPRKLTEEEEEFRTGFMYEELEEYIDAMAIGDMAEAFDALVDLTYVVLGTAYMHGFNFNEGWRRVHNANMKKMRAPNAAASKRNSTLDVIKPIGWKPPTLEDLV